jgi:hypothetical protein
VISCSRHSPAVPIPASPCFKSEMICSSLWRGGVSLSLRFFSPGYFRLFWHFSGLGREVQTATVEQGVFSASLRNPVTEVTIDSRFKAALTPRVLRKHEIHVISDAIADLMAEGPHTT